MRAITIVIAAAAIVASIWRFTHAFRGERQSRPPHIPVAGDVGSPILEVTRIDSITILLDDLRAVVATRADAERHLDTKAAQLLALVGGGAGVIAVVGAKGEGHLVLTPLVVAALICLAVVILACVMVLAPRRRGPGSVKVFSTPHFLNRRDGAIKLTHELMRRYQYMATFYGWLTTVKGAYYFAGIFAFVLGVTTLVLNAVMPAGGDASSSATLQSPASSRAPTGP